MSRFLATSDRHPHNFARFGQWSPCIVSQTYPDQRFVTRCPWSFGTNGQLFGCRGKTECRCFRQIQLNFSFTFIIINFVVIPREDWNLIINFWNVVSAFWSMKDRRMSERLSCRLWWHTEGSLASFWWCQTSWKWIGRNLRHTQMESFQSSTKTISFSHFLNFM